MIFLSPGVKTRLLNWSSYVAESSTCTVAMVGGAIKGEIMKPTLITNETAYINTFGEPRAEDYGAISAIQFLQKGNQLYYVRIAEDSIAQAEAPISAVISTENYYVPTVKADALTITLTSPADTNSVEISEVDEVGKTFVLKITKDPDGSPDEVFNQKISFDQNSTLYVAKEGLSGEFTAVAPNQISKLDDVVRTVTSSDPVASISGTALIRPSGDSVILDNALIFKFKEAGTLGNSYEIELTNVAADKKSAVVKLYRDKKFSDSFTISIDPESDDFFEYSQNDYFDIKADYEVKELQAVPRKEVEGGSNGLPAEPATVIKALSLFSNPDDLEINIICAPGVTDAAVQTKLLSIAEDRADCFAILDPPKGLKVKEVIAYHNGTSGIEGYPTTQLNSTYGAMYYPWVQVNNDYTGEKEFVPPSGPVLATYANNDEVAHPWFAPAGLNRGQLVNALGLELSLDQEDRDILYGSGNAINPIINYRGSGIVIWGQRTLSRETTALDRVNVMRLTLLLRRAIATSTAFLLFDQNDAFTWAQWVGMVTPYMERLKTGRALYDYKVIMDETTVTPQNIDRGEMPGKVYFQPTKTAEFIPIDFILTSTGASFS